MPDLPKLKEDGMSEGQKDLGASQDLVPATGVKLDMSGGVGPMPGWAKPVPTSNRYIFWADLSPFERGYVEAAKVHHPVTYRNLDALNWGFSDLHPETLAAMLKDCERWLERYPQTERTAIKGANAWRYRQEQLVERPDFPSLHLHLNDDGKVCARERQP